MGKGRRTRKWRRDVPCLTCLRHGGCHELFNRRTYDITQSVIDSPLHQTRLVQQITMVYCPCISDHSKLFGELSIVLPGCEKFC